ncbi:IS630 family transposase [Halococcus thailandensis]|uniref:IS630 family transposase n=1 Tax=Halococcus thailandensis TaxID=335952 RepID=UPI001267D0C8|nr:IS630 family transposase [Halococcus thailandensis]
MTKPGNKISGLTKERVSEQLADEADPKAIKRLTAAREYLEGLSPEAIEEKYGWHHQTVYNWLNRFEERGFDAALYDKSRPGRPSELSDDQFERSTAVLHESPEKAGYDDPAWGTALAQHYLIEEFDIAFSRRHTRRLMHKAGVSPKRPRPEPASADEDEREEFEETVKKVGHRDEDATVVTIDQTRKAVGADLYAAWYPVGERPTVGVSASREGVNLLGAVTEYGETTVLECGGSFTGEVTIRFLEHLQEEFGKKLVVLLDQATYFTAGAVKDFVADEPIELVYFPTGSPDLNPTEEYWRRLKLALANRYFGSCAVIRSAVWTALESIRPPGIYQYLCL